MGIEAAENPWWVLATAGAEAQGRIPRAAQAALSRRYWNAVACAPMAPAERAEVAQLLGVPEKELRPLTEQEDRALEAVFQARLGTSHARLGGAGLPDFSAANLPAAISFAGFVFPAFSHFGGAEFSAHASFSGAVFLGLAQFSGAIFRDGANFTGAQFLGAANFQDAGFHSRSALGRVGFRRAVFSGSVRFSNAVFDAPAQFTGARFHDEAQFWGARFNAPVQFAAQVDGDADFSHAAFSAQADFAQAQFSSVPPAFHHVRLHLGCQLPGAEGHWPTRASPEMVARYASLRRAMRGLGRAEAEALFLMHEMRGRKQLAPAHIALLYWAFDVLSRYGHSVGRPLLALALLWGLGVGVHMAILGDGARWAEVAGANASHVWPQMGWGRQFLPDGYAQRLPAELQVMAAVQGMVGLALQGLLALGLWRRFRLK